MHTKPEPLQAHKIRMLDRFYGLFILFCLALLVLGVPFVFYRKLVSAVLIGVLLAGIFMARRLSRSGNPERSLVLFSSGLWILLLGVLYGGLPPNGAGLALATCVMLAVVVSNRAAVVFSSTYLLMWLVYIVLQRYGLAPEPYFAGRPLVAWVLVFGAFLLILIPIPELVRALNEGGSLQRSVLEATSDAILVVDLNGAVDSCNQRFVSLWGIPQALIDQKNDAELLNYVLAQINNPQAFIQRVTELYAHPEESSFDTLTLTDHRVIERYSHPNRVNDTVVGRVWSFRDVTESATARQELQSSQAKLQGLFDLSPLGMARNGMDGRFHEVNPAFTRMLGYSLEELNTMSYWDITPRDYEEQEAVQLANLRTRGGYGPYEKEYIHKDGHQFPVRLNGILIQDAQRDPYIWSIIEDITEQKAHESILTEARKVAEEASVAKSQFLANMSHEIRTPMNAITGLLNLLQSTELTDRQRDYASKTEGAAQSLLGLINDILDFSKVEAGKMTIESDPLRLDALLRNVATVLSSNLGAKDIEVLFDVDPALPAWIRGDALRLQQILINLGGNAVKFTAQGQVVLALRQCASTVDSVSIAFSVEDTGIGIAPENQAYIFTGFSQAEGSTTRKFGGTGLGLAISRRLVQLMGGDMQLTSALGQGSTFAFTLRFPLVTEAADAFPQPTRPPIDPQSVLVIDDNPIARTLLMRMARSFGWSVEAVEDGARAIATVNARLQSSQGAFPFSLVLVDWHMPGIDGWETLKQIRGLASASQYQQPTVIMLSANGREMLNQRTREEHDMLNGFLVKPVTAAMFLDAVVEARQGHSGLRQMRKGRASRRRLAGMRILVVEDNLINQQVAEELLNKEGAIVALASNGRLGVEAVASAAPQFDVVLMDIQMPVLDGYAATKEIRDDLGLHSLPIVAMTANAMASDRDACLAGGMNEHVGKPFDMSRLVSLLIRVTGFAAATDSPMEQAGAGDAPPTPLAAIAGMDLQGALSRMAGARPLYQRTGRDFLKILATLHGELREQLQRNDQPKIAMTLHTLKGNAGTLGLTALAQEARRLEQLCTTEMGHDQCHQALDGLAVYMDQARALLGQAIVALEIIAPHAPVPAAAQQTQAVHNKLRDALAALSALLAQSDMEALQKFAEMRGMLEQLPDALCDQLDATLQALDMEAAYQICQTAQEVVQQMGHPG